MMVLTNHIWQTILRRELRQFGVSVHLIEPGGFVTNIYHGLAEQTLQLWKQLSPDVQQKYGKELVNFGTLAIRHSMI